MLDKLQTELITAMKAGDKSRTLGLRNIIGKIKKELKQILKEEFNY